MVVPQVSRTAAEVSGESTADGPSVYRFRAGALLAASTVGSTSHTGCLCLFQLLFIAHLVVGLATCSAIEEGKPWARSVELIRFVALLRCPAADSGGVSAGGGALAVVVQLTLFGLLWRGKSVGGSSVPAVVSVSARVRLFLPVVSFAFLSLHVRTLRHPKDMSSSGTVTVYF